MAKIIAIPWVVSVWGDSLTFQDPFSIALCCKCWDVCVKSDEKWHARPSVWFLVFYQILQDFYMSVHNSYCRVDMNVKTIETNEKKSYAWKCRYVPYPAIYIHLNYLEGDMPNWHFCYPIECRMTKKYRRVGKAPLFWYWNSVDSTESNLEILHPPGGGVHKFGPDWLSNIRGGQY